MDKMIEAVHIRDKMLDCQRAAKFLWGNNYNKRVQVFKDIINAAAIDRKTGTLEAVLLLCKNANTGAVIGFMAAAVELIEPQTIN